MLAARHDDEDDDISCDMFLKTCHQSSSTGNNKNGPLRSLYNGCAGVGT